MEKNVRDWHKAEVVLAVITGEASASARSRRSQLARVMSEPRTMSQAQQQKALAWLVGGLAGGLVVGAVLGWQIGDLAMGMAIGFAGGCGAGGVMAALYYGGDL